MANDPLTWLHCSDFHVGKDRTAQERLLGRIVEHLQERVATGCVPDLVFITGDPALSPVLAGWSLADETATAPPENRDAKLSLAGLGVALGALHERFADPRFNPGRSAVAWLGVRVPLDAKSRGYFERHRGDAQARGSSTASPDEAITQLRDALTAAWEVSGRQADLRVASNRRAEWASRASPDSFALELSIACARAGRWFGKSCGWPRATTRAGRR